MHYTYIYTCYLVACFMQISQNPTSTVIQQHMKSKSYYIPLTLAWDIDILGNGELTFRGMNILVVDIMVLIRSCNYVCIVCVYPYNVVLYSYYYLRLLWVWLIIYQFVLLVIIHFTLHTCFNMVIREGPIKLMSSLHNVLTSLNHYVILTLTVPSLYNIKTHITV